MAFISGTPIFTDSGWKNIEDISGRDRVLVKNFIGQAQFIQPFALQRRQYDGDIIEIGAKDWVISVTPQHQIIYDDDWSRRGLNFKKIPAQDYILHDRHAIHRRFKFIPTEEIKKEQITIYDEFGKRTVTVAHHDWYKLLGYVLTRGFIKVGYGKPMLHIRLESEYVDEELHLLGDILDRIGLRWHVAWNSGVHPKVVVSSRNNLARRLITRLGHHQRRMFTLPDKVVYGSSGELARLLIDTFIETSRKPGAKIYQFHQLSTTNKGLIDSLTMLGTLHGYGVRHTLSVRAGSPAISGITKRDSYLLRISDPTDTYSARYKRKVDYSGKVYEIDLFEGQIYIKKGSMPVWVDPK